MQLEEPTSNVSEEIGDVDSSVQASDSKVSKKSAQSNSKSQSKFKNRPTARASKKR